MPIAYDSRVIHSFIVGNSTLRTTPLAIPATTRYNPRMRPSKAVAIVRRDEVLALLREGKRLSDIEPVIGVSHAAISKSLKDDPEYQDALVASFDRRLDLAEDKIESAAENVDVSRARAYHDALKWRAGVECTKFRDKQDATGLQIQVVIAPNGVAQTPTIESVAVRLPDNGQ